MHCIQAPASTVPLQERLGASDQCVLLHTDKHRGKRHTPNATRFSVPKIKHPFEAVHPSPSSPERPASHHRVSVPQAHPLPEESCLMLAAAHW